MRKKNEELNIFIQKALSKAHKSSYFGSNSIVLILFEKITGLNGILFKINKRRVGYRIRA